MKSVPRISTYGVKLDLERLKDIGHLFGKPIVGEQGHSRKVFAYCWKYGDMICSNMPSTIQAAVLAG